MALSPGERKFLGKRGADACDAQGIVLVQEKYLRDLQDRAVVSFDKTFAEKQIHALREQIRQMGEKNSWLQEEIVEAANWRLTGKCRACNAEQKRIESGCA